MTMLWSMINTLQLLEFLPAMSINMPVFTLSIFKDLTVSSFNIIPFESIYKMANYTDVSIAYSDSFAKGNIESSNLFFNMPDIICIFIIFLFEMPLIILLKTLFRKSKCPR